MKRRQVLPWCIALTGSLLVAVGCGPSPDSTSTLDAEPSTTAIDRGDPIVIGYSSWAGWWPWAIAEEKGLFEANGANVELKWFDGYLESMNAFAAGELDGNSQTLNDTISFAADAVNGAVVVLVNDNSNGNDKIIVSEEINTIADLKGKTVAIEEGVVDDFLLNLALTRNGMSRDDVEIKNMETGAAAAAFASGQADAVGAFPPFWQTALQREGSKELVSSAEFSGAIPDLLVMSQTVIDEQPEQVQSIVNTWFDILAFMEENPNEADAIMAKRAGVIVADFQAFKDGTRMFTIDDNLEAFSDGESMKHMPYAAEIMEEFMIRVGFIPEGPDLTKIFDDRFVKEYAESQ
ncbi:MAG: ABC transporter substrate-binding protein [Cyanobacteria bacterium P01_F01_bin.150]